jgi:uncharacterized protein YecE (DUF72 family)
LPPERSASLLSAPTPPRIGCAGWSIHARAAAHFPPAGSHLERYAAVFSAVEINSSFYREHRIATYERWARSVPDSFRFSLKIPRTITHERRLVDADEIIARFLPGPAALGSRCGPLVIQLPPSLQFDPAIADAFFASFRRQWSGPLACEPRHAGWFTPESEAILRMHRIARAGADPARVPEAATPAGWPGLAYRRLHGSPRVYFSEYSTEFLAAIAAALAASTADENWCIFDNTALGAAAGDALTTRTLVTQIVRPA